MTEDEKVEVTQADREGEEVSNIHALNISALAAQLTGGQRAMLARLRNGQPRNFALGGSGFALLRRNLAFVNEFGARHLTDLGHAVLAELELTP